VTSPIRRLRTRSREADALGFLGLARRAGAVTPGVTPTRQGVRAGEVKLVLFAADASEAQLAKVKGILRHREIPVRWVSSRALLGAAMGEVALSVVGVTTASFADPLLQRLPTRPPDSPGGGGTTPDEEEPGSHAGG